MSSSFLVYGLGISGLGVVKFLQSKNFNIYIHDDNKTKLNDIASSYKAKAADISLQQWQEKKLADFIVCSPGVVVQKNNFIQNQIKLGCKLISDLDLVKQYDPSKNFIGITGTNGKSTTSSLVSFLLNAISQKNSLGGNIGKNLLDADVFGLEGTDYVVEVSSYQAELLNFSFDVACITNITPDHIDHHGSFDNYANVKMQFVKNAKYKVVNHDDETIMSRFNLWYDSQKQNTIFFSTKSILAQGLSLVSQDDEVLIYLNSARIASAKLFVNLPGEHNLSNIACAFACVICACENLYMRSPASVVMALVNNVAKFKGLEHRIEMVKQINNITFVNDSKATNVQSCEVALKCFNNIILLAGGVKKDEGVEYFFGKQIFEKVLHTVCYGQCGEEFFNEFKKANKHTSASLCLKLEDASKKAFEIAKNFAAQQPLQNFVVLLSPCTASFDEFKNFEHRGNRFKQIVDCFI